MFNRGYDYAEVKHLRRNVTKPYLNVSQLSGHCRAHRNSKLIGTFYSWVLGLDALSYCIWTNDGRGFSEDWGFFQLDVRGIGINAVKPPNFVLCRWMGYIAMRD